MDLRTNGTLQKNKRWISIRMAISNRKIYITVSSKDQVSYFGSWYIFLFDLHISIIRLISGPVLLAMTTFC